MRKFVIVTDSCSDLDRIKRDRFGVDYIPMHMVLDGKEYPADLDWKDFSVKEFYDIMRAGKRFTTAQITKDEYVSAFSEYAKKDYDILSVSCSSALSASYASSVSAAAEVMELFPDCKICCVDSLNSCMGLGLMCITASAMRDEGKNLDEIVEWLEANKLCYNQECTVDSLTYFKRAGRVSAAAAFFGGILSVKPIIISDKVGMNNSIEKVKGKKNALDRIIERTKNEFRPSPYQKIVVSNADCEEDAEYLVNAMRAAFPDSEILTGTIGPIIGATAGPGTVAIFFYGAPVEI